MTVDGRHVAVRFADGTRADVQLDAQVDEEVRDDGGTAPVASAPA